MENYQYMAMYERAGDPWALKEKNRMSRQWGLVTGLMKGTDA